MRTDGRKNNQIRETHLSKDFIRHAEGSCLIDMGNTRVVCTATVEDKVPAFLRDMGGGWVTAEYGMLPRSTRIRVEREDVWRRPGRSKEIQRMIGRSLRAVVDLKALGERTIKIDCDVIQADGGTRTASVTGGFVALTEAISRLRKERVIGTSPLKSYLAGVSCGIVNGERMLDLNYSEDVQAEVDINFCLTGEGKIVEIQGTAEKEPFPPGELERLLSLAQQGVQQLIELEKEVLVGLDM